MFTFFTEAGASGHWSTQWQIDLQNLHGAGLPNSSRGFFFNLSIGLDAKRVTPLVRGHVPGLLYYVSSASTFSTSLS